MCVTRPPLPLFPLFLICSGLIPLGCNLFIFIALFCTTFKNFVFTKSKHNNCFVCLSSYMKMILLAYYGMDCLHPNRSITLKWNQKKPVFINYFVVLFVCFSFEEMKASSLSTCFHLNSWSLSSSIFKDPVPPLFSSCHMRILSLAQGWTGHLEYWEFPRRATWHLDQLNTNY